jgi:hypothetical protein
MNPLAVWIELEIGLKMGTRLGSGRNLPGAGFSSDRTIYQRLPHTRAPLIQRHVTPGRRTDTDVPREVTHPAR